MIVANWRKILEKAWTVRWAIANGAVLGLLAVWDVFVDKVPLWTYVGVSVGGHTISPLIRILDQKGACE